jgi:hypothetical protein
MRLQTAIREIESLNKDKAQLSSALSSIQKSPKNADGVRTAQEAYLYYLLGDDFDTGVALWRNGPTRRMMQLLEDNAIANCYDYMRIRFLYSVRYDFPSRKYLPLGERLLARSPTDTETMRMLLRLYAPQRYKEDEPAGIQVVQSLMKAEPNRLSTATAVGMFYYYCWQRTKSNSAADVARKNLERGLALTKSEEQRALLKETLSELK